jgi:demethylmenaquinone methyltransferase/2-methoxy-6-polyprenyl-1,4-benzoquinol methylase
MTVDKSERRVRAMFAEIARRYDFLNHFLSAGTDVYWRWRTVRAAARDVEGPILDVCTGTGDLAFALRKRFGSDVRVVGTDFTREMLAIARTKAVRRGVAQADVTFIEADTQSLPFSDDTFGLVTVAFGLRNVTNTLRGLEEMTRVCRPGGEVFILEFSRPEVPMLGDLYGWYFRNVLPRIGQFVARNRQSAYEYLPESVGEFPSGRALAAIMEKCSLAEVRYTPLTFGVATLYRGRKPAVTETTRESAGLHTGATGGLPASANVPRRPALANPIAPRPIGPL